MATVTGGGNLEKKLKSIAAKAPKVMLRVGFLSGSTYPDGTSVPMVAAIQEFGAPRAKIPPRPFFRTMVAAKKDEWPAAIRDLLKKNDWDAKTTLETVGEGIKGQLQQSIADVTSPPLSPITLMLRKMFGNDHSAIRGRDVGIAAARVAAGESTEGVSDKPLIWTGYLRNKVDYEVKT